jgi:hypothetical protein
VRARRSGDERRRDGELDEVTAIHLPIIEP